MRAVAAGSRMPGTQCQAKPKARRFSGPFPAFLNCGWRSSSGHALLEVASGRRPGDRLTPCVTAVLRKQITQRALTGRVPSILSLAQEHQVSHRTAARSLATLRDEGLIVSVHGKGYYVAERA